MQLAETMLNGFVKLASTFAAVLDAVSIWHLPCEQDSTCATVRGTLNASDEEVLRKTPAKTIRGQIYRVTESLLAKTYAKQEKPG